MCIVFLLSVFSSLDMNFLGLSEVLLLWYGRECFYGQCVAERNRCGLGEKAGIGFSNKLSESSSLLEVDPQSLGVW